MNMSTGRTLQCSAVFLLLCAGVPPVPPPSHARVDTTAARIEWLRADPSDPSIVFVAGQDVLA